MDIFYYVMNYSSKGIIAAACCGAFKRKSVEQVNQLIENLAKSNYRAQTETSGSSNRFRGCGMLELNRMTAIEAKLDALMSKMSTRERRSHSANAVGIEEGGEKKFIADEGLTHEGPYQMEEAQFESGNKSYNDRTLPRPYLNSCLEDPAGHFNGLLETDSLDRRNPKSEPSLSITGLLV